MVQSGASTPEEYLAELPPERLEVIKMVRQVILDNLADGFVEGMEFGMLSYHVPLEDFGDTYNGRPLGIAALANQKDHMAVYLMGIYGDPEERAWFTETWKATGIKLDMGQSCVRFRNRQGVPLGVIGQAIARATPDDLIAAHESVHAGRRRH
jgi:hypothetical protein